MPGKLGLLALAVCLGLASRAPAQPFDPPSDHDQELGVPGFFTSWHRLGYDDPVTNCVSCHGSDLKGGAAGQPSCYLCHGEFWVMREVQYPGPAPPPGGPRNYPDSHTFERDVMPLSAGDVGWDCWYCHYNFYWSMPNGGADDKKSFWHAPGHGTPYESGCTRCHGPDLDGVNGFAVSCYWCHQSQWAGGGVPPDHKNTGAGSELKGGFAWHRFGWDDPYSVYDPDTGSPDGCTRCHGPNLNDGFAPSCFSCHGPGGGPPLDHTVVLGVSSDHKPGYEDPFGNGCTQCHGPNLNDGYAPSCYACHGSRWNPHDFSQENWLPHGENHCHVCHLPPSFNGGTDSTPVWNHATPNPPTVYTVTNSTLATVGQPAGKSAKCMDCHQGAPGPAVDDFGGATGGTYFVSGEEAFGTDLAQHHPVSFSYQESLDQGHQGLYDPSTTESGLSLHGTIDQDMLESGQLECTACHDQHDNSRGNYLVETAEDGLCFICHKRDDPPPLDHHIPGRADPWGAVRGTTFNCTMCHGENLEGSGAAPACDQCHNDFVFPDAPLPGHHGDDRHKPYFHCAACHADPLTGVVTGNQFGNVFAPSCYRCHDDLWNVADNDPPQNVAMPDLSGTVGQAVAFDATAIDDPDGDPLAYQWLFGDGSQAQMPSHEPTTSHTFEEPGTYHAALAVTDGIHPPDVVEFNVTITDGATGAAPDHWNVTTTQPDGFGITFEDHNGSLVGSRDDGGLAFGIEFVGVIFWMDLWMDLSQNVYWGTGDMYFGNIDRQAGTMDGVLFDDTGGTFTFSASAGP